MSTGIIADAADEFITRWSKSSGAERANFQDFAYDLCDLSGVSRPDVSVSDAERNTYAFERAIESKSRTEQEPWAPRSHPPRGQPAEIAGST